MCLSNEAFFREGSICPNSTDCILCAASTGSSHLPMLRVTVMMFRDIVESVMLLNDEDWRAE